MASFRIPSHYKLIPQGSGPGRGHIPSLEYTGHGTEPARGTSEVQEVAKWAPGFPARSLSWPHYFCPPVQIWARKLLPVSWLLCGPRRYASSNFKVNGGKSTFGSQGGAGAWTPYRSEGGGNWKLGPLGLREGPAATLGCLQKGPGFKGEGGRQWCSLRILHRLWERVDTTCPRSLWGHRCLFPLGLSPRGSWGL